MSLRTRALDDRSGCGHVGTLQRRAFLLRLSLRGVYCAIVLAFGFAVFRVYEKSRERYLVRQLAEFSARADVSNTVLVARRLLSIDPNNLPASRAMASMTEKAGRAEALDWRRKVIHLESAPENQIALARTALRFGQPDLAESVLNSLPENARQSVEYHQVAGGVSLAQEQPARAEAHFVAALREQPQNPQLNLGLATLHLFSTDEKIADEARATLAQLAEKNSGRTEALRALAADALGHHERAAGAKWAAELNREKNATFTDELLLLEATQGSEAFAVELEKLQARAVSSPAMTSELITWLSRHELAAAALEWSAKLPAQISSQPPVLLAIAEAHSFAKSWEALRDFVAGKNWNENEALRLAVESHALRHLSAPERPLMEAETAWRAALKKAQTQPAQLVALAQLSESWGYREQAEEAWWAVANGNENTRLALSALQRAYKAQHDTRGLFRVAQRALALNPNDLVAANNCASLGLLLQADGTARRLAFKLHSEHPADRTFVATYAFALRTEGKVAEGLKVMESLREEELRRPDISAYYVVMLVDAGKLERARDYLASVERAALLPEEQQLLEAASRKLASAG